jgi:hypothetical protein
VRFPRSLGIGVGTVLGSGPVRRGKKEKYVVVDSNGDNDPNRAILGLFLAAVQSPETRSPVGREPGFHESESYCTFETGYSASIHPLMPPGWR